MLSAKQGACLKLLAFLRSMYTGVSKFTVTLLFSVIGDLVGDDRTLGYTSSTNRNVGYCIVNRLLYVEICYMLTLPFCDFTNLCVCIFYRGQELCEENALCGLQCD